MLRYPFEVGARWLFQRIADPAAGISSVDKKILAAEQVRVPAGDFACFKIQWLLLDDSGSPVGDVEQLDYIAEQGLVKRTVFLKDYFLRSAEIGAPSYIVDRRVETLLADVDVRPE